LLEFFGPSLGPHQSKYSFLSGDRYRYTFLLRLLGQSLPKG
jgi:hypothetical protein